MLEQEITKSSQSVYKKIAYCEMVEGQQFEHLPSVNFLSPTYHLLHSFFNFDTHQKLENDYNIYHHSTTPRRGNIFEESKFCYCFDEFICHTVDVSKIKSRVRNYLGPFKGSGASYGRKKLV